ncbi:MAG: hypothetical protein ABIC40_02850, partial [bacterium]
MAFKTFQRIHLLALLLTDLIVGFLSILIAYNLAFVINQATNPFSTWMPFPPYLKLAIIWAFLNVTIFGMGGLYSRRPWESYSGEFGAILTGVSTSMIFAMAITFFVRNLEFSRLVFMTSWIVALLMFWIFRYFHRLIRRRMHSRGMGLRRLFIWGDDEVAKDLLKIYDRETWRGKRPVG